MIKFCVFDLVLIMVEVLFLVVADFQDNEAILKMNFSRKHTISKRNLQKIATRWSISISFNFFLMIMHN